MYMECMVQGANSKWPVAYVALYFKHHPLLVKHLQQRSLALLVGQTNLKGHLGLV